MAIYKAFNGPAPTTAVQAALATGTAIKTMLQVATPANCTIRILEWGVSFDGAAAAAGVQCELLTTGTVNATVTAHTTATVQQIDDPTTTSIMTMGTTATGYNASAEGTITSARVLDSTFVQPTSERTFLWPMSEYPLIPVSTILRVRVKAAATVNMLCWVRWAE